MSCRLGCLVGPLFVSPSTRHMLVNSCACACSRTSKRAKQTQTLASTRAHAHTHTLFMHPVDRTGWVTLVLWMGNRNAASRGLGVHSAPAIRHNMHPLPVPMPEPRVRVLRMLRTTRSIPTVRALAMSVFPTPFSMCGFFSLDIVSRAEMSAACERTTWCILD